MSFSVFSLANPRFFVAKVLRPTSHNVKTCHNEAMRPKVNKGFFAGLVAEVESSERARDRALRDLIWWNFAELRPPGRSEVLSLQRIADPTKRNPPRIPSRAGF